jgi:hypothetical protein
MYLSFQKTNGPASQQTTTGHQYSPQQAAGTSFARADIPQVRQFPPQLAKMRPTDPSWKIYIEEYFPKELNLDANCHIQFCAARDLLHCEMDFKRLEAGYGVARGYADEEGDHESRESLKKYYDEKQQQARRWKWQLEKIDLGMRFSESDGEGVPNRQKVQENQNYKRASIPHENIHKKFKRQQPEENAITETEGPLDVEGDRGIVAEDWSAGSNSVINYTKAEDWVRSKGESLKNMTHKDIMSDLKDYGVFGDTYPKNDADLSKSVAQWLEEQRSSSHVNNEETGPRRQYEHTEVKDSKSGYLAGGKTDSVGLG